MPKDEIEISCRAAAKQTHKTYAIIAAKTQHQGPELIPDVYKEIYLLLIIQCLAMHVDTNISKIGKQSTNHYSFIY